MSNTNEKQFYLEIMKNAWNDIRSSISDLWQMTSIAIAAIALTINVLFAQQDSSILFNVLTGWFVMAFLFSFLGFILLTVFWTTNRIESRTSSVVEASKRVTEVSYDFAIITGDSRIDKRVSVDKSKELPMMEFPVSYFRRFFGILWIAILIIWIYEIFILPIDLFLRVALLLFEIIGVILYGILINRSRQS